MSYGRRNDNFGPKPVEAGKEYDVQITEVSRKGDGIARIQGFVIFVKDGKVGQNAKIRISQIGPRFATAEVINGSASVTSLFIIIIINQLLPFQQSAFSLSRPVAKT
jgi:predicted RNA-binding protein with TRAM domain